MLGKDAFQEADIFGITMPVVKHSYLVQATPTTLPRVVREAYHIATTGRPGPVLIDVPKDISQGPFTRGSSNEPVNLPGYRPEIRMRDRERRHGGRGPADPEPAARDSRRPRRGDLARGEGTARSWRKSSALPSPPRCSARACSRIPTRSPSACWACTAPPTPTARWSSAT